MPSVGVFPLSKLFNFPIVTQPPIGYSESWHDLADTRAIDCTKIIPPEGLPLQFVTDYVEIELLA